MIKGPVKLAIRPLPHGSMTSIAAGVTEPDKILGFHDPAGGGAASTQRQRR
jgi:hypothetical protein